ncbi:hypothetical protein [Georgenia satyanarayanai]|uniref:hypothetical protein n=1 Tax=Georgenia satyanarayanai TaxID=860221 RepID=UPI0012655467|nr:hypothetical protein [Georgenia satyanarayanai]
MAAVTLAAGCGGGDIPNPNETAAPRFLASNSAESDNELPTGEPLAAAEPVRLSGWAELDDGVLRLRFSAGTAECFGATVEVEESESEVQVGVRVGTLESMASVDCIAMAFASHVDVEIGSPIGHREVIDMNTGS